MTARVASHPSLGPVLPTVPIGTLLLPAPLEPGRPAHMSAASGVVAVGDEWVVVSDDENSLGIYDPAFSKPGRALRALPGVLPAAKDERGKHKPDFEAAVIIPAGVGNARRGAWLLAVPSGSKTSRQRGAAVHVSAEGQLGRAARPVDLAPLFEALRRQIGDGLNIEGAVVRGDQLILMHRGNSERGYNALIEVPLAAVRTLITSGKVPGDIAVTVRRYELGTLDGVPLTFSDGALLPDGSIAFTASAEGTSSATTDGGIQGSAVGIINPAGKVTSLRPVEPTALKVEGIAVRGVRNGHAHVTLVTDADDPARPSQALSAELPLG